MAAYISLIYVNIDLIVNYEIKNTRAQCLHYGSNSLHLGKREVYTVLHC